MKELTTTFKEFATIFSSQHLYIKYIVKKKG